MYNVTVHARIQKNFPSGVRRIFKFAGGGGSKHIFGYFTMVDKFNFWGA